MKNVYVLGDIHGDFGVISSWIKNNSIVDSIIVQVGDFGVGFHNRQSEVLSILDDIITNTNNILFAIKGNHDNPSCFAENNNVNVSIYGIDGELDCSDLEQTIRNFKSIHLLPDYSVVDINDEKWLFVGGAISIDRKQRIVGQSYWFDEIFVYDEEKVSQLENIDRIIAHTSPDFCPPVNFTYIVYSFAKNDYGLISDLKKERADVSKLFSKLKEKNALKSWINGHFHESTHMYHGSTEFISLSINEFKLILGKDDYV